MEKVICTGCGIKFDRKFRTYGNPFCSNKCRWADMRSKHIGSFDDNIDKSGICWEWKGQKGLDGYGYYLLTLGERSAHRISFVIAYGRAIQKGNYICHRCDNPSCVRPDHLFEGTPQDNNLDCIAKGRSKYASFVNGKIVSHSRKKHIVLRSHFYTLNIIK